MTFAQQVFTTAISIACDADKNMRLDDQYRKHVYVDDLQALYELCEVE